MTVGMTVGMPGEAGRPDHRSGPWRSTVSLSGRPAQVGQIPVEPKGTTQT